MLSRSLWYVSGELRAIVSTLQRIMQGVGIEFHMYALHIVTHQVCVHGA